MSDPNSLERFLGLPIPYAAKLLAMEAIRRGGGKHFNNDLGAAVAVLPADAARAALVLKGHDLNCAPGHDHVQLPIGCRWYGMFARAQPAVDEAQVAGKPADDEPAADLEGPDKPAVVKPPKKAVKP